MEKSLNTFKSKKLLTKYKKNRFSFKNLFFNYFTIAKQEYNSGLFEVNFCNHIRNSSIS